MYRYHAAGDPPGIKEGPRRAPSSPPETPDPTNKSPFDSKSLHLLIVSGKCEFPPNIKRFINNKRI